MWSSVCDLVSLEAKEEKRKEYIVKEPKDPVFAIEKYSSFYGEPIEELIRCKDCKHCRNYCRIIEGIESKYACELKEESGYPYGQFRVHEDDYCSRAERKEE